MKMNTKDVILASVLAALYVGIGLAIPMISFGGVQCRIGDALYPLIAVLGARARVGNVVTSMGLFGED